MLNIVFDLNMQPRADKVSGHVPVRVTDMATLYSCIDAIQTEATTVTRLIPELIPGNSLPAYAGALSVLYDDARRKLMGSHYVIVPFSIDRYLAESQALKTYAEIDTTIGEIALRMPSIRLLEATGEKPARDTRYFVMAGNTVTPIETAGEEVLLFPPSMLLRPWDMSSIMTVTSMRAMHAIKDDTRKPFVQYILSAPSCTMVIACPAKYVNVETRDQYFRNNKLEGLPGHLMPLASPWGWWTKKE